MAFFQRLFSRTDETALAPADFMAQRTPEAPVLDVRTPREYATGHLEGALHVDVNRPDFDAAIQELAETGRLDRSAPVYLYCRTGNRSGVAAQRLRALGFVKAYNVGGLGELQAAGATTAS